MFQVCRVCFGTECKLYSMTAHKNLYKTYETLTGLLLENENDLPQYLCSECAQRLISFARFRAKSLQAHLVLLDTVKKKGSITKESIQSINYIMQSPLTSNLMYNESGSFDLAIELIKEENVIYSNNREDSCHEDISVNNIKVEKDDMNDSDTINNGGKDDTSCLQKCININVVKVEIEESHYQSSIGNDNQTSVSDDTFVSLPSFYEGTVDCIKKENDDVANQAIVNVCFKHGDSLEDEYSPSDASLPSVDVTENTKLRSPKSTEVTNTTKDSLHTDTTEAEIEDGYTSKDTQILNNLKTEKSSKSLLNKRNLSKIKSQNRKFTCQVNENTGENSYSCNICKKRYSYKSNLQKHLRIHSDAKPHKCHICTKEFAYSSFLQQHLQTHYGEKPHSCNLCQKSFSRMNHLRTHLRIHSGEKPYVCDVCNKGFNQKSNLQRHVRLHFGDKPHLCDVCDKGFIDSSILQQHLRIHSEERPYICNICDKGFSRINHLRTHSHLVHSDKKPYTCGTCNKSFKVQSKLQRHIRTHSGEKPYSCDLCDKKFSEGSKLRIHLRIHSGEKPYLCGICNRGFSHKCNLRTHLRTHCRNKSYSN